MVPPLRDCGGHPVCTWHETRRRHEPPNMRLTIYALGRRYRSAFRRQSCCRLCGSACIRDIGPEKSTCAFVSTPQLMLVSAKSQTVLPSSTHQARFDTYLMLTFPPRDLALERESKKRYKMSIELALLFSISLMVTQKTLKCPTHRL